MTFPFSIPLSPCCVVVYLPWWQTLFELSYRGRSFRLCRFSATRRRFVPISFVLLLLHRHVLGRSLERMLSAKRSMISVMRAPGEGEAAHNHTGVACGQAGMGSWPTCASFARQRHPHSKPTLSITLSIIRIMSCKLLYA